MKLKYAIAIYSPTFSELELTSEVIDKLSLHLARLDKGSEQVLLTPMARQNDPYELLKEFDELFNSNLDDINDILYKLEQDNRNKFGPRSISLPWEERKELLLSSFDEKYSDGCDKIIPLLGEGRLRPISIDNATKLLKNNTNSGLPFNIKKREVKEFVSNNFDILLQREDPCILFTRTTEQKKTRNVWGFPIVDTLNEMMIYSPLLAYQKKLPYRAALVSPDEVSRRLTEMIINSVNLGMTLYSIDFAAYDTSVKSQLQKVAFDYIRSCFQYGWTPAIDDIARRFLTIGICTPDGIFTGEHGVPSGSTFTNEVDSIVQAAISLSLPYVSKETLQVQGDDGVYLIPNDKIDELKNTFVSCGLNVNEDKSYISNNYAVYLQNLFHIDYIKDGNIGGIYPIYRALNRILFQEKWSDFDGYSLEGRDFYAIRSISIMENCKHHPLHRKLVEFVLKYDKYSLNISDEGIIAYVKMLSDNSPIGEILNHQYGDNISGIRSFETYKIIQELS